MTEAGEGEVASKQVAGKLGEILAGISKVSDLVSEISVAARDQAAGIEQVTRALGEMDKVTQQNAASSEETSSAASELNSQSEELAAMVGQFRITDSTSALGAPAGAAALAPAPAKRRNGLTASAR